MMDSQNFTFVTLEDSHFTSGGHQVTKTTVTGIHNFFFLSQGHQRCPIHKFLNKDPDDQRIQVTMYCTMCKC